MYIFDKLILQKGMKYQQLSQIIIDSVGKPVKNEINRLDYEQWLKRHLANNFIKVITGFRRTGKSYLLKQLYHFLVKEKKVPEQNIFFINFENPVFARLKSVFDLQKMFEVFKQEAFCNQPIYLFLDEIQNIQQWEKFVRTLYDKDKEHYQIFLTGSNSQLLSSDLSSALGGRVVELRVHPFSLEEMLKLEGFAIDEKNQWDIIHHKLLIKKQVNRLLNFGSLPETIQLDEATVKDYLEGVFRKVLLDDIIKRFKVDKTQLIESVFSFLMTNTGGITSINSITKAIRVDESKISSPTVAQYISYYEKAFAVSKIACFSWKAKQVFEKVYKYYPVDNSFITFFSSNKRNLQARLLESAVFNHLQRFYKHIYYGKDTNSGREIDFIIDQGDGNFLKIQVCWELNDNNCKRELGNFTLVNKYLAKGKNVLITMAEETKQHFVKNAVVEEIPMWQFLLNRGLDI